MTRYTAHFVADVGVEELKIEAEKPEDALRLAREIDPTEIVYEPWEGIQPSLEIIISDSDHEEVACWLHDDMRLRRNARSLLEAAEQVVDCWERGDLANAVRELCAVVAKAKGRAG